MNVRKLPEELLEQYRDRKVVLVDESDNEIGVAGLVEAHREPGKKHRAFSLWLYRRSEDGVEVLLQKRAKEKPVFPHYWANTCCYNMAPGEEYLSRAVTRVSEEMGVEVEESALCKLYQFSYYAPDIEGWCENELDQVIVGECPPKADQPLGAEDFVKLNPDEVEDYRWMGWGELKTEIRENPEVYAPWFGLIMEDGRVEQWLK